MYKSVVRALFAALLVGASGLASAQSSCDSHLSFFNSSSCNASCKQSIQEQFPECFVGTNTATSSAQIAATSIQQITTISTAVSSRLLALGFSGPPQKTASLGVTGLAAGGSASRYNVWGSLGSTHNAYNGDAGVGNADKSSSTVTNTVLGFDYGFAPNFIVGLSAAVDHGNGSTGHLPATSTTSGVSYAPYVGWQISKNLALDASAGWGDGEYTSQSTTKADTKRSFAAANLTYNEWFGNIQAVGKAGYLTAKENYSDLIQAGVTTARTSSSNRLSQFRIAGEAGYWMNGVMPFAGLAYSTDSRSLTSAAGLTDTSKLGKDAFTLSLGVNFFSLASGVTGGIVYTQESGRSNGKNNSITANAGFRF